MVDKIAGEHPWICFHVDLQRIPESTWVSLGQCVSKIEHMLSTPLMPRVAEKMRRLSVSKGIQGTAAIEGNTLDLEEVQRRLDDKLELPDSQEYLGVEIDNLQQAHNLISALVVADEVVPLAEARICEYNRLILDGLDHLEPEVVPGQYATKQHGVGTYLAPSPRQIRELMPKFVAWLNDEDEWRMPPGFPQMVGTILKAVTAHLYLAWIHPFGDGNGRVARMIETEILARGGVPDVSYHLLAEHYNRTRTVYYSRLAATSRKGQGDPHAFTAYAIEGFADGLRGQIEIVKRQHREVAWRDYVYERFRGDAGKVADRRRRLAMDLALQPEPVAKADLRSISAKVAELYGVLTQKAVSRDVGALLSMDLLKQTDEGMYVPNVDILDAFTPNRRRDGHHEGPPPPA